MYENGDNYCNLFKLLSEVNDHYVIVYAKRNLLFADDTNLTASSNSVIKLEAPVNIDLENLRKLLIANKLCPNMEDRIHVNWLKTHDKIYF